VGFCHLATRHLPRSDPRCQLEGAHAPELGGGELLAAPDISPSPWWSVLIPTRGRRPFAVSVVSVAGCPALPGTVTARGCSSGGGRRRCRHQWS
jgi:hypothetical protein